MSQVVVHGIPGSPYVRSVLLGLHEKGAAHRFAAMDFGDPKSAAHISRHPFGRIPAIEHGDFQLYETQAILRYLNAVLPGPDLQSREPRLAARADQICGIVDWYLFPQASAKIGFHRLIRPMMGGAPDEAVIAAAVGDTRRVFGVLDGLLADQPFLAGDALSIADLMVAPHLDLLEQTPEGVSLLADTQLLAWLRRMRSRPSMIATTIEQLRQAV